MHFKIIFAFVLLASSLIASDETTYRVLQFENEQVRVWKTVIAPHQPLNMHRDDLPRVVVPLKGGDYKKIEEDGSTSTIQFVTGEAVFFPPDPQGQLHAGINESPDAIEVIVVELKNHPKE